MIAVSLLLLCSFQAVQSEPIILVQKADALSAMKNYKEAEGLYRKALSESQKPPINQNSVLTILEKLSEVVSLQGRTEESETIKKEAERVKLNMVFTVEPSTSKIVESANQLKKSLEVSPQTLIEDRKQNIDFDSAIRRMETGFEEVEKERARSLDPQVAASAKKSLVIISMQKLRDALREYKEKNATLPSSGGSEDLREIATLITKAQGLWNPFSQRYEQPVILNSDQEIESGKLSPGTIAIRITDDERCEILGIGADSSLVKDKSGRPLIYSLKSDASKN